MNSRTTSTPLGQRTRWWGKTALLGAMIVLGGTMSAQVATGYTFAQSAGAYTPITGGTVLVTQTNNTTSSAGSLDDGTTYLAPMPFSFTYDGGSYATCTVTNNGSVSFGGTPITATTYTPISGTGTYSAAVAAYGRDLQGGFVFAGTRTLGSATITAASNTDGVTVGSVISGTGIAAAATVLSKTATTVVMSAVATATSTATACWVWNGEMRYETLGAPGSYIHVIQWSNMKPFGTTLTTVSGFRMNMQVRLYQATGKIEVVYGDCANVGVTSTGTAQVGLRGPNNTFATNVNNRQVVKGASTWGATAAGILNTSGCIFNSVAPADVITSGLTFAWTPLVCSGTPAGGTAAFSGSGSPACANTTRVLACTGQSAIISGISYAWQVGAAPGGPYVPVSGGSGATTATYTTGPLAAGTYYYVMTTTCSNTPASTNSTELTLVVNPSPTAVITMSPVNGTICGAGTVALTASGGATYAWSPATGLDAVTGATVNSTTTQTRVYTVVADDGAGCTDSEVATVTVAAAMPAPTASISPNPICPGATASLTSSVTYGGYTMTSGGSSFIDISVTGTSVGTISDDSEHFITIPSFTFNGVAYTQATVGNNGAMSFGAPVNTAIHFTNLALPAAVNATDGLGFGTPSNIAICPWWDDFTPGGGSSVRTQTVGGLFIIQWTAEDHFSAAGTGTVTFQAQLELATGNIYFCYSDVNFTGIAAQDQAGSGTVGLNFGGGTAQQWSFDTKVLFDGQVIAFIKNTVGYGWTGPNAYTAATQNPSRLNCQVADEGVYVVTATAQNGCSNTGNTLALDVDDTDTDGDLTADCNDGCPLDPLKIAPGQCGCGVADTDTDGDLTADCNDGCPADPLKIAPGICGCGVADTDTDGDLTADCNDGCPADPLKIAPGICGCGVADTDTDGDLTADCNDGCPADPLKIAPGICGCGVADTDTDGDLTADCIDGCPADPLKIAPGICGCGVADTDTDGDLTADCNDGCPADPLKIAPGQCGCGVADTDTDGDLTADCNDGCPADPLKIAPGICGCGVADTDTDGDLTADCNDGCPADPLKIAPGICGCGVADTDTDGDLTADCNDGCPADPLKIAPGICGCGVADTDTDGDLISDCIDNCPNTPGVIGSVCNDGNPFTGTDVLQNDCSCAGTPVPCDNWVLTVNADGAGSEITWQIVDATSPFVLATGGPYLNNSTNTPTICVPQGACFNLTFTDGGNNGIVGGGWKLVDNFGRRILDNTGNGGCFTTTSTNSEAFCNQPSSTQTVIATDCDRVNWLASNVITASPDGAVSAQYGIGDQTDDGYWFWFTNPCGGYTRKIFRNHATSGGNGPANAVRAAKLKLSTIVTNPLPSGTLLNVRVRTQVNGGVGNWGPACLFKIDPTACTLTQLNNTIGDPNLSCGVTGKVVGASGNTGKIFAKVVTSGGNPATNYRFEFVEVGEGYLRNVVSTNAALLLAQWQSNPLLCGTYTYTVRVQASFDGGATYCPYGVACAVEITNNSIYCTVPFTGGGGDRIAVENMVGFSMYPNPNRGDQLFLNMYDFSTEVNTVTMDMFDIFGKRVMTRTFAVADGEMNQVVDLGSEFAAGLYMVNITAGETVKTERLVIQR